MYCWTTIFSMVALDGGSNIEWMSLKNVVNNMFKILLINRGKTDYTNKLLLSLITCPFLNCYTY